jgi:ParB family chromosome partitioning protein
MTAPTPVSLPIAELHPATRNPNVMSEEQVAMLRAAIRREGFLQPVLVARRTAGYEIIDGHHRTRAASEEGMVEVPGVVLENMPPDRAEALRLAMNRLRGDVDLAVASQIITDLSASGWKMEELLYTGFSSEEIDDLLAAARHTTADDLLGQAVDVPADVDAPPGEYVLELRFTARDEFAAAKRQLKKLGSGDMTTGLLRLLGDS